MDSSKAVVFPNELLDEMLIEQTFFPSNSDEVGVAVLSHIENDIHIMRIYQLLFNHETSSFEPVQEMASFSFQSQGDFNEFLERLPNLTGLEMLMILNPLPSEQTDVH